MSNQRSRHNPDSLTSKPKLYITGFSDSLPRYLITSHSSWAIMQTDKSPFRTASQILKKSSTNFSPHHQFQQPPLTFTPQQPPAPSSRSRCRRCSALGHDTKDCRTKDPVAVKKRVSNNRKARKSAGTPTVIPPQHSPFHGPGNLFGDPMFHLRLKPSRLSLRTQKS